MQQQELLPSQPLASLPNLISKSGLYDLNGWPTGQVKYWLDSLSLWLVTGWLVICSLDVSKKRGISKRNLSRCHFAENRAVYWGHSWKSQFHVSEHL